MDQKNIQQDTADTETKVQNVLNATILVTSLPDAQKITRKKKKRTTKKKTKG